MSKNWTQGDEITADGLNNQGLKVVAQDTPVLTLKVHPGVAIVDGTIVKYAGGNTPSISAPSANPRIDLVAIDSAGTISIVAGSENASPTAPAYPADKTVLAEVYCKVSMTQIFNTDQGSGKGYVYRDSRPLGAGISLINSSAGSADAGKGIKTNSDGLLDGTFLGGFGDGSDGDITLDGSTDYNSWSSRSGSDYTMTRDVFANNLTINSTRNLITNGWRIFVKGTIAGAGTIKNNGNNGGNAPVQNNSTGGAGGTAHAGYFPNVAGPAGANAPNGNANAGTNGTSPAGGLVTAAGGNGGKGGRGDSGAGGSPNGGSGGVGVVAAVSIGKFRWNTIHGLFYASGSIVQYKPAGSGGSGGGGGDTNGGTITSGGGGGGGASGGIIAIYAKFWAGTFTMEAKGGNGGNGANAVSGNAAGGGGGGGGAGGFILVVYEVKTWSGSKVVTGGALGTRGLKSGSGQEDATDGTAGSDGSSLEVKLSALS